MQYRSLGKTGLRVSELGLGCEHLQGQDTEQVKAVVDAALDVGINLLDVFMSEPQVRSDIGQALTGRRDQVILQGHIGAIWQDGQYARSRDLALCETFFQDLLTRFQTDYMDIGMIHFVDTEEDFEAVFHSQVMDYALGLKQKGAVRLLGMSSHNPVVAAKAVETGLVDVLMFSLNPAYDLLPEDTDIDGLFTPASYADQRISGLNPARARLYQLCENQGVAITVMKALGGGALLNAKASPYQLPLSVLQCMHYALTRPAVASVLVGCKTPQQVREAARYSLASPEEKDYAPVLSATPAFSLAGKCMYCNHCLPCPVHIDIAQVNKYLDLALLSDKPPETLAAHYNALSHTGADCIACGQCESRCPCKVPVIERMEQVSNLLGSISRSQTSK